VPAVAIRRDRVREKALGHGLLRHRKAERPHAVAHVEADASLAGRPGRLSHPVAAEEPLGLVVETVGHHVTGAEKGELLVERPVVGPPAPVEQRKPRVAGRRKGASHHGPRIGPAARRPADVDGDPPDRRCPGSAVVPYGSDARPDVRVVQDLEAPLGHRFAASRQVEGQPHTRARDRDQVVPERRPPQRSRVPLGQHGRRPEGQEVDVRLDAVLRRRIAGMGGMGVEVDQPRQDDRIGKPKHLGRRPIQSGAGRHDAIPDDGHGARSIEAGRRADDAPCVNQQVRPALFHARRGGRRNGSTRAGAFARPGPRHPARRSLGFSRGPGSGV